MSEKRHAEESLESSQKRIAGNSRSLDSATSTIWNLVSADAAASIKDSHLDDAILQSSNGLEALRNNTLQLLELRASVWAKKAHNAKELDDALAMIQTAPDHSIGYLHTGRVYMIQGYQDKAMDTFKKGLDLVLPSDINYTALQQEYDIAEARCHKRIDFTTVCPYDVVLDIFAHCTDDDVLEATMVSHCWRNIVMENQSWWEAYEFDTGEMSEERTYRLLSTVSHNVEYLTVKGCPQFLRSCLKLMQRNVFPKLQSLEFHAIRATLGYEYNFYNEFWGALSIVGKKLTQLQVIDIKMKLPPVGTILSICRNLTDLCLYKPPSKPTCITEFFVPHTPLLTSLSLLSFEECVSMSEIRLLLRCSPALERLCLCRVSFDVISAIERYCHNLTYLLLNTGDIFYDDPLPDLSPGVLQYLVLGGNFTVRTIQPLLQAHHDTLTALTLSPENNSTNHDWHSLLDYSFPSLETLYIGPDKSGIHETVPALIRQCPSIQSITLDTIEDTAADKIFESLSQLSNLECIVIHDTNIDGPHLPCLLRRCPLKLLVISNCKGVTDELLEAIASSAEHLNHFELSDKYNILSTGTLESLTRMLQEVSSLEDVVLRHMALSDTAVQNLCTYKSLKRLEFYGCKISNEGRRMVNKLWWVDTMYIENC